jgi:predicted permease
MSDAPRDRDDLVARWRDEARRALPGWPDEVREEIAAHAADRWREARDAGRPVEEADARARRELAQWPSGPPPAGPEPGRRRLAGLRVDLRSAWRALTARPAIAIAAILLGALAVGAAVTAATLVHGILLRPLPYPDGDRLGVVWQRFRGEQGQVAYPDYTDFRSAPVFDAAAALSGGRASVRAGDRIERVNAIGIEPAGLDMLGARPIHGRLLRDDDAGAPVVLVSHRFWRRHLSADPAAVGRPLWMSGTTYTIVGVLQEQFDFELPVGSAFERESHDVWMPFDSRGFAIGRRDVTTYEVLVRLAPGASAAAAQSALDAIGARLEREHAATNTGRTFEFVGLRDHVTARARRPLALVLVAGAATFVIALANLVTLTLVRVRGRRREQAVREALGASAGRLRMPLVIESVLIAVAGGVAGVWLASFAVPALVASEAANLPRPDAIRVDVIAGLIAALLAAGMATALSLLPVRSRDAMQWLRASARATTGGTRLTRRVIVPVELALAVTLSTGGALLALSLARQMSLDPGYAVDGVSTVRVSAYAERYPDRARTVTFFRDLVARADQLPGVAGAAASSTLPLSGTGTGTAVTAFGRPATLDAMVQAGWQFVTPGYFAAAGVPLLEGRDFTPDEMTRDAHVTIISASLAARLFPGESAIGRRIATFGSTTDWHDVIGVAGDVRHTALTAAPQPRVYDLLGQHWGRTMFVVARTGDLDADLTEPLRLAAREIDADAPAFEAATMATLQARSSGAARLASRVAVLLAIASVLIALVGVYGVVAANAAERTREFGVRLSLGARPIDLHRRVVREHAGMLGTGALLGIGGCAVVVPLLDASLYQVQAGDAATAALALAVALGCVSLVTALAASRRTAVVDPVRALRD